MASRLRFYDPFCCASIKTCPSCFPELILAINRQMSDTPMFGVSYLNTEKRRVECRPCRKWIHIRRMLDISSVSRQDALK
ncbi:hypothetical protein BDP55DRAFT_413865 [Colletotrichum godetiae]|uniref:Uncharacterized protein n=1 Tax=Colletotrichum godetiae TaxID=1209918 RepID=A0AAJ0A8L4_9PEZI|nr:uncharacterized protein BDP55DRAFT_413865 [Colletotrichum godetiae]KAK1658034.1 hypothetical protein BDP55DRAFT_413865 [Colletotrichum godetiae]